MKIQPSISKGKATEWKSGFHKKMPKNAQRKIFLLQMNIWTFPEPPCFSPAEIIVSVRKVPPSRGESQEGIPTAVPSHPTHRKKQKQENLSLCIFLTFSGEKHFFIQSVAFPCEMIAWIFLYIWIFPFWSNFALSCSSNMPRMFKAEICAKMSGAEFSNFNSCIYGHIHKNPPLQSRARSVRAAITPLCCSSLGKWYVPDVT